MPVYFLPINTECKELLSPVELEDVKLLGVVRGGVGLHAGVGPVGASP